MIRHEVNRPRAARLLDLIINLRPVLILNRRIVAVAVLDDFRPIVNIGGRDSTTRRALYSPAQGVVLVSDGLSIGAGDLLQSVFVVPRISPRSAAVRLRGEIAVCVVTGGGCADADYFVEGLVSVRRALVRGRPVAHSVIRVAFTCFVWMSCRGQPTYHVVDIAVRPGLLCLLRDVARRVELILEIGNRRLQIVIGVKRA